MGVRVEHVTSEVRLSFVTLMVPQQYQGTGDPRYGVRMLMSEKEANAIQKAAQQCRSDAKAAGMFKGVPDSKIKMPNIENGDETGREEEKGLYGLAAYAKDPNKPQLLDENNNKLLDEKRIYSGCFGRVALNLYASDKTSNGIFVGMTVVKKTRDGDPFDGTMTEDKAKALFEEDVTDI